MWVSFGKLIFKDYSTLDQEMLLTSTWVIRVTENIYLHRQSPAGIHLAISSVFRKANCLFSSIHCSTPLTHILKAKSSKSRRKVCTSTRQKDSTLNVSSLKTYLLIGTFGFFWQVSALAKLSFSYLFLNYRVHSLQIINIIFEIGQQISAFKYFIDFLLQNNDLHVSLIIFTILCNIYL